LLLAQGCDHLGGEKTRLQDSRRPGIEGPVHEQTLAEGVKEWQHRQHPVIHGDAEHLCAGSRAGDQGGMGEFSAQVLLRAAGDIVDHSQIVGTGAGRLRRFG